MAFLWLQVEIESLTYGTSGHETNSSFTGKGSVETAAAGCEEEESFARIK